MQSVVGLSLVHNLMWQCPINTVLVLGKSMCGKRYGINRKYVWDFRYRKYIYIYIYIYINPKSTPHTPFLGVLLSALRGKYICETNPPKSVILHRLTSVKCKAQDKGPQEEGNWESHKPYAPLAHQP